MRKVRYPVFRSFLDYLASERSVAVYLSFPSLSHGTLAACAARVGARWRRLRLYLAISLLFVMVACGTSKPVGPGYYRVERGDTLSEIARKHGQSVSTLTRWNKLSDPNKLEVGQVLRVSDDKSAAASPSAATSTGGMSSTVKPVVPPQVPDKAPPNAIRLAWPAQGRVAQGFNVSGSKGLTIVNSAGTSVVAAAAGTVAYSGSALRGYGNLIILKHGNSGFMTVYAHNRKLLVGEGVQVRQGQQIAEMGDSDSSQVALYFELRYNGEPTNPTRSLPPR